MVESSALITGMPTRTWCPQAFVLFTVLVPVLTGATSATAAARIVVVDGGVDDVLYVGPFYSQMPNTTTEIFGVFHRCVVHHPFVSDAFPKAVGPKGVDVYLAERRARGRYPCPVYGTCIWK